MLGSDQEGSHSQPLNSKKIFTFLLSKWFLILLGVFIALAHSYPEFARNGGTLKAQYTIGYGAVAIIFLISGMSMPTKQLLQNAIEWRAHLITQIICFLVTSAVMFGFVEAIKSSNNPNINEYMLVGMIFTGCLPTTISSNVVMTREAHGNDSLALIEVFIGNLLGVFMSPALLQMYMTKQTGFNFANPKNEESMTIIYRNVMKQLGLSVFIPLFVGQLIQNFLPKQSKWCLKTFYLGKVGSFMLLLLLWSSFSTAFYQNAFKSISTPAIILLVFFNIGIYLFYTSICFFCARPFFILRLFDHEPSESDSKFYLQSYNLLYPFYYNKRDTVAIMLCGAAKTAALGVSLMAAQFGSHFEYLGVLLVPLVLYQGEQIVIAQLLLPLFRWWIHRDDEKLQLIKEEKQTSDSLSIATNLDHVLIHEETTNYITKPESN